MKRLKLQVENRTVVGKNVKRLRKDGILPANVYGKDIKSVSVQVKLKDFDAVYKEAGETGLVDLTIGDEVRPVLIHNVQNDYMTRLPIHADFYQVNLKEKVKTMVPLVLVGQPKAVAEKIGIVLQPLSEIEVEALPTALPENIEVNIEPLAAVDEQITVKDLKVPGEVTVLTDPEQVVVKIGELISKEAQEQAEAEAKAAEAAKAETAIAEGTTPTEGAPAAEGEAPLRQGSEGQAKPAEAPKGEEKKPARNASQSDAGGEAKPEPKA